MELIVREATILDAGYYQCHGRNEYGVASSSPTPVIVNGTSTAQVPARNLPRFVLPPRIK